MINGNRLFRDQVADAAQEKHPGEGDDKRRDLQRINKQAHKRAKGAAHHQHQRKRHQRRNPPETDRFSEKYAGKGDHRPDRQIDPAGEDHEGHADGDDPKKGIVGQDIADHPRRGKAGKLGQAVKVSQYEDREGNH